MSLQLSEIAHTKFKAVLDAIDAFRLGISDKSHLDHGLRKMTYSKIESESHSEPGLRAKLNTEIAALQEIDIEVQKLLSAHHQMINMLSPIHKLPREILSNILQMVWKQTNNPQFQFNSYQRLEGVCIHWWNLMRAMPLVYTGAPASWNERMIETSGDAPLTVVCMSFDERLLQLVEPHIHRWGSFEGSMAGNAWTTYFLRAAPRLKSFSLNLDTGLDIFSQVMNLFDGNAPNLTRLAIPQISIPWDSGILRGLQSLHIPAFDGEGLLNSKIRSVLEASPNLQELVLTGDPQVSVSLYHHLEIQEEDRAKVHLPYLRLLHLLETPAHLMRWALDTIRAPRLESIHIDTALPNDSALGRTFGHLSTDSLIEGAIPAEEMRMVLGEGNWAMITFESVIPSIGSESHRVQIGFAHYLTPTINLMVYVGDVFPSWVHATSDLLLCDCMAYTFPADYGSTAKELLCGLVNLKTLRISHQRFTEKSSILKTLGSPVVTEDSASTSWPCPKLTRLELRGSGWFKLPQLLSCLKTRYGLSGDHDPEKRGHTLPPRLESLVLGSEINVDDSTNSVIREIREVVGSDVVRILL